MTDEIVLPRARVHSLRIPADNSFFSLYPRYIIFFFSVHFIRCFFVVVVAWLCCALQRAPFLRVIVSHIGSTRYFHSLLSALFIPCCTLFFLFLRSFVSFDFRVLFCCCCLISCVCFGLLSASTIYKCLNK